MYLQFDVVPPDTSSVSSLGPKKGEEPIKKRNPGAVKIRPWTLAQLNAEDISRAASEARKKSKILRPVVRGETPLGLETSRTFGGSGHFMTPKPDNSRRRLNKQVRLPADLPMKPPTALPSKIANNSFLETSISSALQFEARSAFQTSRAMSSSAEIVGSSPESSLDSPDIQPFQVSSSGPRGARQLSGLPTAGPTARMGIPLSRSASDGYEASGGEDSDRVPNRMVQRSSNWNNLPFRYIQDERIAGS